MPNESRRPDYILVAKKKDGEDRTYVGAAWKTKYDGISIRLNPCVTLSDREDVWLILQPNDEQHIKARKNGKEPPRGEWPPGFDE